MHSRFSLVRGRFSPMSTFDGCWHARAQPPERWAAAHPGSGPRECCEMVLEQASETGGLAEGRWGPAGGRGARRRRPPGVGMCNAGAGAGGLTYHPTARQPSPVTHALSAQERTPSLRVRWGPSPGLHACPQTAARSCSWLPTCRRRGWSPPQPNPPASSSLPGSPASFCRSCNRQCTSRPRWAACCASWLPGSCRCAAPPAPCVAPPRLPLVLHGPSAGVGSLVGHGAAPAVEPSSISGTAQAALSTWRLAPAPTRTAAACRECLRTFRKRRSASTRGSPRCGRRTRSRRSRRRRRSRGSRREGRPERRELGVGPWSAQYTFVRPPARPPCLPLSCPRSV